MTRGGKRIGAGRPEEPNPKTIINFRATEEEKQLIHTKAKLRKLSIGRYIIDLVRRDEG